MANAIAPHAFFEAPFHARLPANHPAMLSPWERLEKAGRFVDDDEDEKVNKPRKKKQQKKTTKVEAVDDIEVPVKEEKDPLFADDASDLLDAALGLDDDEDEAPPPSEGLPLRRRRVGRRAAGLTKVGVCVSRFARSVPCGERRRAAVVVRAFNVLCGGGACWAGGRGGAPRVSCGFSTFRFPTEPRRTNGRDV